MPYPLQRFYAVTFDAHGEGALMFLATSTIYWLDGEVVLSHGFFSNSSRFSLFQSIAE